MGSRQQYTPVKLAPKLASIRKKLGLSQSQLIEKLDCKEVPLYNADISNFESGKREPPLIVLKQYAKIGGVTVDYLIDDELDLPEGF